MSQYQYHRINNGEKSCNTVMRAVLLDEIGTKDNFLINDTRVAAVIVWTVILKLAVPVLEPNE